MKRIAEASQRRMVFLRKATEEADFQFCKEESAARAGCTGCQEEAEDRKVWADFYRVAKQRDEEDRLLLRLRKAKVKE